MYQISCQLSVHGKNRKGNKEFLNKAIEDGIKALSEARIKTFEHKYNSFVA